MNMGRNTKARCPKCKKVMRSDNLVKHIKLHEKPYGSGMLQIQNPVSPVKQTYANHSSNDANDNEISKYTWKKAQTSKQHSPLMPSDIRMIICGKSGFGKTTLLMRLQLEKGMIDYNNLHVCGRSLHQPEYQILKHGFENNFSKNQV